jgi:hypothetical protein
MHATGVTQGSVLSPILNHMYINNAPKHMVLTWPSLQTTPDYMRQIAMRILLLEKTSAVSA